MSSSTFEVREAENESDRVLGFGLETCEENGIAVSAQLDGDVPKDHTYTKEPDVLQDEALKSGENSEELPVNTENNVTDKPRAMRTPKGQKIVTKRNMKPKAKKDASTKKDVNPSRKSKAKKEVLTEESNTTGDSAANEKSDEQNGPDATNEDGNSRPKRKGRKRKVEEKENVLDRSIVEEIENIAEETPVDGSTTESPAKKKNLSSTSAQNPKSKKNTKGKNSAMEGEEDHNLPKGWLRKTVVRKSGKTAGQIDIYIYSPDGIKFRSKPDIAAYLAKTKSPLKLEDFNFSKKKISDVVKAPSKREKLLPVKPKAPALKKKVQPVATPTKKTKLLVKINFSPKSKKGRLTKKNPEKQSKTSKISVKGGKASGASLKGNISNWTLDTRDLKSVRSLRLRQVQNETNGMSNVITPDKNYSTDSFLREATVLQKETEINTEQIPIFKVVEEKNTQHEIKEMCASKKGRKRVKKKIIKMLPSIKDSIVKEVNNISEAGSNMKENSTNIQCTDLSVTISRLTESEIFSTYLNQENVPSGWKIEKIKRKSGKTAGFIDIYVYNPEGLKFRSKAELTKYLAKVKSPIRIEDFKIWNRPSVETLEISSMEQIPKEDFSELKKKESTNADSIFRLPGEQQHIRKTKKKSERNKTVSAQMTASSTVENLAMSTGTSEEKTTENDEGSLHLICENKTDERNTDNSFTKRTDLLEDSLSRPRRSIIRKTAAEMLNLPARKSLNTSSSEVRRHAAKKYALHKMKMKIEASSENVSINQEAKHSNVLNSVDDQVKIKRKGEKRKHDEKENVHYKSIAEEVQNISKSAVPAAESEKLQKKKETLDIIVRSLTEKKLKCSKMSLSATEKSKSNYLPEGWVSKAVERKSGKTAGQVDIYIFSPDGIKFRSKSEIAAYLAKTKSSLKLEDFAFSRKEIVSNSRKPAVTKKIL